MKEWTSYTVADFKLLGRGPYLFNRWGAKRPVSTPM
ncbi:MAG: hypothetical protein JWO70_3002, partial [Betaproteobacteria bacterium]|nr:hypothetical protein [Betaproteobacteria bacterium]